MAAMTDLEKAQELWQVLVMLKREMDPHTFLRDRYEIPVSAWKEAVRRANMANPNPPHFTDGLLPANGPKFENLKQQV